MRYAILIYSAAGLFDRLPAEEQAVYLQQHRDLQAELTSAGTFVTARLMPHTSAVTLKAPTAGSTRPILVDGPFAETKERFGGFYVIDCETLEQAIEWASRIVTPFSSIEVRPVAWAGGLLGE